MPDTELDLYEVKYRGGQTFVHAADEESALQWVKERAYDGQMHEDEATVNGPMSDEEANERGNAHREKWKEIRA